MWIQRWADTISRLGLSSMALALVELCRPLGPLGSQALLFARPLLAGLQVERTTIDQATLLLENAETQDAFSACLKRKL